VKREAGLERKQFATFDPQRFNTETSMNLKLAFLATLALAAGAAHAQSAAPGVSKTEIVLGTTQDLSGPLAAFGKQIRMGMQMRVDEANEMGGVHGRKIKLLIEDDGYDPKKSVLATQKMVSQDGGVFAIVGRLGTAQNVASMPVQFDKNVINFLPITAAREMYEPIHKLKFSTAATYYDQMRIAAPRLVKDRNLSKPCIIYQDDDFEGVARKDQLQARCDGFLFASGQDEVVGV
jgi:branched-chain amino acid transport system substrate-binding protein